MAIIMGNLKKNLTKKTFQKRFPVVLYPRLLEKKYENICVRLSKDLLKIVRAEMIPRIPALYAEFDRDLGITRTDDFIGMLERMIGSILLKFAGRVDEAQPEILKIATEVDRFSKDQHSRLIRQVMGVNILEGNRSLTEAVNVWVRQNVSLIKNISVDEMKVIEGHVMSAYQNGLSHRTLQDTLEDHWRGRDQRKTDWVKGFSVPQRSQLVAIDQLGKLNGQISMLRQTAMGVKRYTWRTALDERVRLTHKALEDKTFFWNSADGIQPPSAIGHPGHDYRCRCYPEPKLIDILGFDPDEPE